MKAMKWLLIAVAAVAVLVSACGSSKTETPTATPTVTATATPSPTPSPTPIPPGKTQILVGASPTISSTYPFFVSAGQAVEGAMPDVAMVIKPDLGSTSVMQALINNTYALGESINSVQLDAYSGNAPWTAKYTDLRELFAWSTQTMLIAVKADSNIKSLADLTGKNINSGAQGSWQQSTTARILDAAGVTPSYIPGDFSTIVADMKQNSIAGFVMFVTPNSTDSSIQQIAASVPLTILSFSQDDVQKVLAKFPSFTVGSIPAGAYQNTDLVTSFSIAATLVTVKGYLSADTTYQIVKAVWANKDTIGATYAPFQGYDMPGQTLATASIPLDTGAIKYFKELGLTVPDKMVPPEAR